MIEIPLDFRRCDVVAGGDDQVLDPLDEEEEAVLVDDLDLR
jgi:hypothetical protein